MENIGLFACFPLSRRPAGGTPALPAAAWLGGAPWKSCPKLSELSLFQNGREWSSLSDQTPPLKKFSNHWKTREKFFQSLENPAHFFQPLEKYFPIIGKPALPRRATGLCKTQAWLDAPTGEVRLHFFADHTRFDNRIEAAMPDE